MNIAVERSVVHGVGIDHVDHRDVGQSIEVFGERYLRAVFTSGERVPLVAENPRTSRHYADRFAAKEAVFKALRLLPTLPVPWTDIEVVTDHGWAPSVTLHGRARRWAMEYHVEAIALSISRSGSTSTAVAIATAPNTLSTEWSR